MTPLEATTASVIFIKKSNLVDMHDKDFKIAYKYVQRTQREYE